MFQFPLSGSGLPGLVKGPGAGQSTGGPDSDGLLQGLEGLMAGLSGELQSLLMQMSPQMQQRLEGLLAGGMSLPQAATALLAEAGTEGGGELFARYLEEGLPDPDELPLTDAVKSQAGQNSVLGKLVEGLQGRTAINPADPQTTPAALMNSGGSPAIGSPAPAGEFPAQLASKLLDMGVPQQVGGKGWSGAIGDRVMWMVQGEQQFAKLKLNPPNLGPLEVRVSVTQDQTSVSFLAQHAAVREALEAAMPRLREMFDQQSLQLVRAEVADPGAQQGDRMRDSSRHATPHSGPWDAGSDDDPVDSEARPAGPVSNTLVDLFA